jgi:uncharacterized protein YdbL (DUF1318 family)
MDRDENAALNVLYKALSAVGLTVPACGALDISQAMKQEVLGVTLEAHVTAQEETWECHLTNLLIP